MLAAGWKLLKELEERGIGTAEVEALAEQREWQRAIKLGTQISLSEFRKQEEPRDGRYVKKEMECRIVQTREDWEASRRRFEKMKKDLRAKMKKGKEGNWLKKGEERIQRHMNI